MPLKRNTVLEGNKCLSNHAWISAQVPTSCNSSDGREGCAKDELKSSLLCYGGHANKCRRTNAVKQTLEVMERGLGFQPYRNSSLFNFTSCAMSQAWFARNLLWLAVKLEVRRLRLDSQSNKLLAARCATFATRLVKRSISLWSCRPWHEPRSFH